MVIKNCKVAIICRGRCLTGGALEALGFDPRNWNPLIERNVVFSSFLVRPMSKGERSQVVPISKNVMKALEAGWAGAGPSVGGAKPQGNPML